MPSYAYYRLPHAGSYTAMTQTDGEPESLASYAALDGRSGFVLAPFAITADSPLLLIRPDMVEERRVESAAPVPQGGEPAVAGPPSPVCRHAGAEDAGCDAAAGRRAYAADFADFHARLCSGEYTKIVLARSADVSTAAAQSPEELFLRACRMYPRMFVVLVSTPQSGTWLAATPEILLEGGRDEWRTIALAGTMRLEGRQLDFDNPPSRGTDDVASGIFWSTKNIQEQRYVATYIAESLKPFAAVCREEGPRTVRAGDVVHLRSDFTFRMRDSSCIGSVIEALHPTPAVCGLPKVPTWRHIVENEHTDRRYYSGFMGPLAPDGTTHLYVSLRCMQIADARHYRLYAGGGLLKESTEELEWRETEAKMGTMLRCLGR